MKFNRTPPSADYRKRISNPPIELLPTGEEWLAHIKDDLLPFWTSSTALGTPQGNFPTFRHNDGSLIDPNAFPPQVPIAGVEGKKNVETLLSRQYTRMLSRQIFGYCVAYHLLGDEQYLTYARAGLDYLLKNMRDEKGGFYTWLENGKGGPDSNQRTSQDQAHALMGPAMYYYLTRDPAILDVLIETKDYIFNAYKSDGYLVWVKDDFDDVNELEEKSRIDINSGMDQLSAYMLTTSLLLDPKNQRIWLNDMLRIANYLKEHFYSPENNMFWARIDDPRYKVLTTHADFGHTVETFWMLYLIGSRFEATELRDFALQHIPQVLKEAFNVEMNTWIEKKLPDGQISSNRVWWMHCELDQVAATMSLLNPFYVCYLVPSYRYWFFEFADLKNKDVWNTLTGFPRQIVDLKQNQWKNMFHDMEHVLVGYITSRAIRKEPVELYFAFQQKPENSLINPYRFSAKIGDIKVSDLKSFPKHQKYAITFKEIGP